MDSNEARQKAAAEQQPNLDVTITKVGTSSVNPGEAGDPDTIIVAEIQDHPARREPRPDRIP